MPDFSTPSKFKLADAAFFKSLELKMYVVWMLNDDIKDKHLRLIEEAFLGLWNSSTGKVLGDGDFKNHVYHCLEELKLDEYPNQDLVDRVVDLMLDYMARIGEWDLIFGES